MNLSEVISSPAWVISNVLATATELVRFFGSPPAFFGVLQRTLISIFATSFSDERSTQVDASSHKHSLSSLPFPRESLVGELDGRAPFFPVGSLFSRGRVSFHTFHLPFSYIVRNLQRFALALRLALGCSSARSGFLQVVGHEKRTASHDSSVPSIGPPYFQVWCNPKIHPFEQYLECTATAMALAAPTVEADGKIKNSSMSWSCLLLQRDDGFVPSRVHICPIPHADVHACWPLQ